MIYDSYKLLNGITVVKPKGNGTYSQDDILAEMESATSLTRSDGLAALTFLKEFLADKLSRGSVVNIEGLGTFGVSLAASEGVEESKLTGSDVSFKRVTFKASAQLKDTITQRTSYEKIARNYRNSSTPRHTQEERREVALQMAAEGREFTVYEYSKRSGLSMATASRDLAIFVEEGILRMRRIGNVKIFSAPQS